MNKFFKLFLVFIFISFIFSGIWGFYVEPDRLILRHVTLSLSKWPVQSDNMKIVVISDIHAGAPFINNKKLEKIVSVSNREKPDYVFLLGDYLIEGVVGGKFMQPEIVAKELGKLKAKNGVFAVLGNHDGWYNAEKVRNCLEKNNITVLENSAVETKYKDKSFWIAGLEDLTTGRPNVSKTLGEVKDNNPIIMLSHDPDMFPKIPAKVALTLSGHTHGGQVTLPFLGSLIIPSKYGQRYAKGTILENHHQLFVSSGIGTSILPVRFGNTPEIIVMHIKNK